MNTWLEARVHWVYWSINVRVIPKMLTLQQCIIRYFIVYVWLKCIILHIVKLELSIIAIRIMSSNGNVACMWQPMTMTITGRVNKKSKNRRIPLPLPIFFPFMTTFGTFSELNWNGILISRLPSVLKIQHFFYSFFNPSITRRCVTDTRWWSSWTACWWCAGSRGSAGPTVTPTTPGLRHRVSYNRWGKVSRIHAR